MAQVWLPLLVTSFFSFGAQAHALEGDSIFTDPAYYQIESIEVLNSNPLTQATDIPQGLGTGICKSASPAPLSAKPAFANVSFYAIDLDTIVNIGKAIWDIVVASKATIDIKNDASTAIPQGVDCWTDLTSFGSPRAEYKTIVIKNFAHMKAVEFQYRMIWLPGGQYDGHGKYIGYATMIPSNVYVMLGWHLTANSATASVYNSGSSSNPIGAVNMSMVYRAENALSTTEQSQSYSMDGEGNFVEL